MLRKGVIVVGLLALVVVGLGAFFGTRALVFSEEDPVEKSKKAIDLERSKPRFRGELGDFFVAGPQETNNYPCPEPYQPGPGDPHNPGSSIAELQESELYFAIPGAAIDAVGSCQGKVISIRVIVSSSPGEPHAVVGRVYFIKPKFEVFFDAPRERLKLMTVGGKPALAELPIPDVFASLSNIVVIERFPTGTAPGIAAWAQTINDLDKAIALVEQIMGVR